MVALCGCAPEDISVPRPEIEAALCLTQPSDLEFCLRYLRENIRDTELPTRLQELSSRHPENWIPQYLVADWNFRARKYLEAEQGYRRAYDIAERSNDRSGQARSHYAWASVGKRTEGLKESIRRHGETLELFQDLPDSTVTMWSLKRLADRHFDLAQYDTELEYRRQLVLFLGDHPNPWETRGAHYMLARSLSALGDYGEAIEQYRTVLRLAAAAEDDSRTTSAAAALGLLLVDLNRHDEARELFDLSVVAAIRDGDPEKIHFHRVLSTLPDLRTHRFNDAHRVLIDLLPASAARYEERSYGHWRRETYFSNLVYLAEAELGLGDDETAEHHYRIVEELAPTVVAEVPHLDSLMGLTELYRRRGSLAQAIDVARRADELIETMRENIHLSRRTHFLHKRADTLQVLASVLAENDPSNLAASFAVVERGHARALRESLNVEGVSRFDVSEMVLEEIQQQLQPGELLLEFMLGEQKSLVIAIDSVEASIHTLPSREKLESLIANYLAVLKRPLTHLDARLNPRVDFDRHREVGRRLHRTLFDPLLERLQRAESLIVVPDRDLHLLPFAALPLDDGISFLGERYPVKYLPAAAFLASRRSADPIRRVVLAAVQRGDRQLDLAPLQHAEEEVRAAAAHWSQQEVVLLTGSDASLNGLRRSLEDGADLLHLSAHAILDARRGPRVLLNPSDWLDTQSIAALPVTPSIVVLSACETGRGELVGGEGVLGLVRAFTLAGTQQVIAALWSVDDSQTVEFMELFHESLSAGAVPAKALRNAQRLATKDAFVHPFYWAPFVVYGVASDNSTR